MSPAWRPSSVAALGTAVVLLLAASVLVPGLYDDAFIHLRIARHLALDGVPWFDPREPVWSSSSTPWTWALTPLVLLGLDDARGMALLAAGCGAAAAAVWGRVVVQAVPGPAGEPAAAAATVAVGAWLFRPVVGGMESGLALAFLGLAVLGRQRDRDWALVPLAVAAAVRPELVLPLGVGALEAASRRRWGALALGLLAATPFVAFSLWFYPTWIPNTILAKRVVYTLSPLEAALLLVANLPWGLSHGLEVALGGAGLLGATGLALGVPDRALRLAAVSAVGVAATYVALHQYVHAWYVPNFAVPLLAVGAVGLARRPGPGGFLLAALAVGPALADAVLGTVRGLIAPADDRAVHAALHVVEGEAFGAAWAARLPDAALMTPEIGGLGIGFPGTLLDGAGLVSPDALRHHPMPIPAQRASGAIAALPPGWVAERRPELVVGRRVLMAAFEEQAEALGYVPLAGPVALDAWLRADLAPEPVPVHPRPER